MSYGVGFLCSVEIKNNEKTTKFEVACTHEEWFRGIRIQYFFEVLDKQPDSKTEFRVMYDPMSNIALIFNTDYKIKNNRIDIYNTSNTIPSSCTWMETSFLKAQEQIHNFRLTHLRESVEGTSTALCCKYNIVTLL